MMPGIYILLPVHNRRELTQRFIACLLAQTYTEYRLILVDDGSTDGTADMVRASLANTTVLEGDGQLWWAGSLQKGLDWLKQSRIADDDLVLFINDDVQFASDYLATAVELMNTGGVQLLLSRLRDEGSPEVHESGVNADLARMSFRPAADASEINCLSTRGLFCFWREVKRIGDFYPRLLPHYLSDYEYTIRAHRLGIACVTSARLYLTQNRDATGYRDLSAEGFWRFIQRYFSKKSANNPLYQSVFVVLACKPLDALCNLGRIWLVAFKSILLSLKRSCAC